MSAAQDFLDEKLSKNKYTVKQQATLDANGGPSVVNREETEAPAGEAYAKYGTSTTSSAGGADKYRGFGQDSDSGRNYSSGAWGSGELDAAGLAAKYKLDTSQEGRGKGHIWGRNADGSEVYIGKSSMDLASNKDLIANHSKQANENEIDHSGIPESLSSSGDIKGAILTEWKGGIGAAKEAEPEPEKERTPIEHSPEVKQAKERVANYENDVLSGKMSQDIFEGANDPGNEDVTKQDTTSGLTLNNMDRINDKYNLNIDQGMNGIGTPAGAEPKSTEATQSFLEAKKTDLKTTYGFKPSTAKIQYGVN